MTVRPLEYRGVSKVYRSMRRSEVVALSDLSLEVDAGSMVALVGPNGAGKTTAMLAALDLVRVDRGEVRVCGRRPSISEARRCVGYLPEFVILDGSLAGTATLRLHGRLAGLDSAEITTRIDELGMRLGLSSYLERRVAGYSKGMLQRLGLALALIGRPDLLLLDEPMSGLDPEAREVVRGVLEEEVGRGVAIVLCTHAITEVESVCHQLAILRKGILLFHSSLAEAYAAVGDRWMIEITRNPGECITIPEGATVVSQSSTDGRIQLECGVTHKQAVLESVLAQRVRVETVTRPRDALLRLYKGLSEGVDD